jgi:methionyl-tRNA formyltransferase
MAERRLLFLGSKKAGLLALRRVLERLPGGCVQAILCPDDRADGRNVYEGFQSLANEYGLALHLVQSAKETTELVRRYQPQTALVHGWYRMIPVAEFPSVDFLGFHFSPLPRYRGSAPLVWQIINGERQLGVSFFQLSEGMDDGELVDQRFFDLAVHENIADALEKANRLVLAMLDDFLPQWLAGKVQRRPQKQEPASYCGMRTPEDGLINWRAKADAVHNFIRAQARPYPGAFSRLADGRVVRFWKSEIESRTFYGVPGAVVDVAADGITVACGGGALRIRHLEVDGEPDTPAGTLRSLKARFG